MKKAKQLAKLKQQIENEDDPFKVIHYYRTIYKCKRRKALRELKIAQMTKVQREKVLRETMESLNNQMGIEGAPWEDVFEESNAYQPVEKMEVKFIDDMENEMEELNVFNPQKFKQAVNKIDETTRPTLFKLQFPQFNYHP